jgi:hypothetical protein
MATSICMSPSERQALLDQYRNTTASFRVRR